MSFLAIYKPLLVVHLEKMLQNAAAELQIQNQWSQDVFGRFIAFSKNGKMARGSIFLHTCEMFGKEITDDLLDVASGLEMIHATLLIHDDVMDNDRLRRGKDTFYVQYEHLLQKIDIPHAEHVGKNLAISAGDIGFFLGNEFISNTGLDLKITKKLLSILSKELVEVGIAQMEDCVSAQGMHETEEEVLSLYKYKTGRYTFSLPFLMAAVVCQQEQQVQDLLSELGEYIGTMFQIQDELLGLFGTEKELGKPIGSDIRENRKTLYKTYLYEAATADEKKKLGSIFGNSNVSISEIDFVRSLVKKNGVDTKIAKLIETYHQKCEGVVNKLKVTQSYKDEIRKLITFMITRTK